MRPETAVSLKSTFVGTSSTTCSCGSSSFRFFEAFSLPFGAPRLLFLPLNGAICANEARQSVGNMHDHEFRAVARRGKSALR